MEFLCWWGLLAALGAACSILALRDPDRTAESPRFHLLAAIPAGCLLERSWTAWSPDALPPFLAGTLLALPGLAWALFLAKAAGFYLFERIIPWWTGNASLPVRRTFDAAEAAVRKGDAGRAVRLFEEAIRSDPKDPATRLALADLLLSQGDRARGEAVLRQALDLASDPHVKAPLLFRISDLRREAGDAGGARRLLQDFLASSPPEPYRAHARERLERIR